MTFVTKRVSVLLAAVAMVMLSGCAATSMMLGNSELEVNTRMSESIFLDPVAPSERTVFIQVRNTTDKSGLRLEQALASRMAQQGYRVVNTPKTAHYWVQVNVLKAGKMEESAAEAMYGKGYGAGIANTVGTGAVAAGMYGAAGGTSGSKALGIGLGAAAAEAITSKLVENVTHSAITDIQIAERTDQSVRSASTSNLQQGSSSTTRQSTGGVGNRMKYRTRTITQASKVNLDWEDARDPMVASLVSSLSGLL